MKLMQLSREQGIGGQAFLEFLWKSLERMICREEHVDMGACIPRLRVNDNWKFTTIIASTATNMKRLTFLTKTQLGQLAPLPATTASALPPPTNLTSPAPSLSSSSPPPDPKKKKKTAIPVSTADYLIKRHQFSKKPL
ncbi:hypothetical protein CK203_052860 [Vitis vinifera]|uniref:Uncharacterized protein n=1 Tax=Vitis vinifera TaxID=29760 RepID=A0A438H7P0_VITVI|nr:hypothetical protein CK203_052860 [Vitis vinifera]